MDGEVTAYRGIAARGLYLSVDRPELRSSSKESARAMKQWSRALRKNEYMSRRNCDGGPEVDEEGQLYAPKAKPRVACRPTRHRKKWVSVLEEEEEGAEEKEANAILAEDLVNAVGPTGI